MNVDSHRESLAQPMPTGDDPVQRCLFHFLRRAPFMPSAADLAVATSPVSPWPHQLRVIRETAARFPQSRLFADEVGLGKTVEAVLVLRRLWISGRVRRALILVPKSVLRQWQEELREKAALDVPIFAGGRFHHLVDEPAAGARDAENPWDRYPIVLASTQTARTAKRRRQLEKAEPWDLLIVDEAHHARRRGRPDGGGFEPNRLLALLAGSGDRPGLVDKARCVYLLTATPMQIHPLEVWDLLRLLGAGGPWGTRGDVFVRFFEQLSLPFEARDWSFLFRLTGDPRTRDRRLREVLGDEPWDEAGPPAGLFELDTAQRARVDRVLRSASPAQSMVWRHTRSLLRRYYRAGWTNEPVPERRPENIWIPLTADERRVYDAIEDYLSRFYQRYEAKRSGLGFVMTVYRRRLTSSFHAIRRSLARRLDVLEGQGRPPVPEWTELDEGDEHSPSGELQDELLQDGLFQDGLFGSADSSSQGGAKDPVLPAASHLSQDELGYLTAFLDALDALPMDSKLARLRRDLAELTVERDRVLVFTQYLDTLDYLRDDLSGSYSVACYSGRGGEVQNASGAWAPVDKESLKQRFGRGEIQVLLCTEAAGEGLNFQSCGVLINYDMPWNPMRVEQRIGRIDRIGQAHSEVWIRNYFYADTVEATIYRRLSTRIDWFQNVLGDLQPILHRVGESLRTLALTPAGRRSKTAEQTLASLEADLERRPPEVLAEGSSEGLDDPEPSAPIAVDPGPVTWQEVRDLVLASRLGAFFEPDEEQAGAYLLDLSVLDLAVLDLSVLGQAGGGGRYERVTFDPELFGRRPYSLQLLTWGNGLFESLLDQVPEPTWEEEPTGIGWYHSRLPSPVDLFVEMDSGASPVTSLAACRRALDSAPRPWSADVEGGASSIFSKERREVLQGQAQVDAERRAAEREALRAATSDVLVRSALVELARAENPGLFDRGLDYGFGPEGIRAQARHGAPFDGLVERLGEEMPMLSPEDGRYLDLRRRSPEYLYRYQERLFEEARSILERRLSLEASDREAQRRQKDLTGLLQRRYLRWTPSVEVALPVEPPLPLLDAESVRPFVDAVPFFDSVQAAVAFLEEAAEQALRSPFESLRRSPEQVSWVCPDGRYGPAADLFVCPMGDDGLEPQVPEGAYLVLRPPSGAPRSGDRLLLRHPALAQDGDEVAVRQWTVERGPRRSLSVTLRRGDGAGAGVLDPEEAAELTIFAEVLEVLTAEP